MLVAMLTASNGITFDCSYSRNNWTLGSGSGTAYICTATASTLDNNEAITAVTDSGSTADPTMTTSDVTWFQLSNGYMLNVHQLPSNMAVIFPNLIAIVWTGSKLKKLAASDLLPYPNLIYLEMGLNMIRKLDGNLFQNNLQLQFIDFQLNVIHEIGSGLLNGLNSLTNFLIIGNICTTFSSQLYLSAENTLDDVRRSLDFLCSPSEASDAQSTDACLANCTERGAALQTRVNILTESVNAPWYYKLRLFLKAVLLW